MKAKYIYSLACAALLTMGMTSCEDKLDIPEKGVLDYNTYYQTDEDAESAIAAAYIQVNSSKYNFHMILNAMGDDFWSGGGARNDNSDLEQFNELPMVLRPIIFRIFSRVTITLFIYVMWLWAM